MLCYMMRFQLVTVRASDGRTSGNFVRYYNIIYYDLLFRKNIDARFTDSPRNIIS